MQRLSYQECLELKEKAGDIGERTVYVNHCKAGEDNRSCGLTKKEDGTILIHCFHCGARGFIREKFSRVRGRGREKKQTRSYSPPKDAQTNTRSWSVGALAWVGKAGLTLDEVEQYAMRYSASAGRVYIPLFKGGETTGWLARRIEAEGQKYLLNKWDDFAYLVDKQDDMCIIVEDCLSAIKIGRQYSCLAICGTSLSDYCLGELAKKYKKFYVWLDNDNAKVKRKQIDTRNKLTTIGKVAMVKTDSDPKTYTDKEIGELIDGLDTTTSR